MTLPWKYGTTIHITHLITESIPTVGRTPTLGTTITGAMILSGAGDMTRTGAGTATLGTGTEAGMIRGTADGTTHGTADGTTLGTMAAHIQATITTTITATGTILITVTSAAVPYTTKNLATDALKAYLSVELRAEDSTAHAAAQAIAAQSQATFLRAVRHLPAR